MSDGKQLLKAFNGLSQEHKDEYIESLYNNRYSYVCPRDEWDYYFDVQVKYYLSNNEELLNELCSRPDDKYLETKCGCEILINSRDHDECRCDGAGENWICGDCYDGEYEEDEPNNCDVCYKECDDKWCEECKLNVWECKYCGDKLNNEIKKCGCSGEEEENKLMVELRALLDKRYIIKQERYGGWSNNITVYSEFDCGVYSKKPNDKFAGYWNCGKCDCHYPCGTSKAFNDLISKYGYRHDVIDCSSVSGLWKIK